MPDDAVETVGRRGRASGRDGRQRLRADHALPAPPYITRHIPTYELLSEDGLQRVERFADRILAEIGFEIRGDAVAHRMFVQAGARLEGERLYFPPGMIRGIIQANSPRAFTQYARNPARNVVIGGGNTVFSPAYGSPFVSDMDRGRRYGSMEDFDNFVKLTYATPWLHHSGGTVCEPVDVPVNKRHMHMVYSHMRWSDKAFMGSVTTAPRAAESIEMCRILFGADFVDRNCVILGNVNVNSPLVLDGEASRVIRTYAAANQAAVCVPFILGGAMGPVTTAAGISIPAVTAELTSPGRSVNAFSTVVATSCGMASSCAATASLTPVTTASVSWVTSGPESASRLVTATWIRPSTQLVNVRQSVPGVLVATGRSRVEISSGSATAARRAWTVRRGSMRPSSAARLNGAPWWKREPR